MKKVLSMIAAAVLCISLVACGDSSSKADTSSSKTESSSIAAADGSSSAAESSQADSSAAESSSQAETSAADSSSSTASTEVTPTAQKAVLTIDVSDINEHYDTLEKGLQSEEFVPKSGKIADAKEVEFTADQTALDVLKKYAADNNIKLDIQDTGYGPFVNGINSVSTGSCGKNSGWMFKVNDVTPDVGADAYKVKAGDKVVFFYICDYNTLYPSTEESSSAAETTQAAA